MIIYRNFKFDAVHFLPHVPEGHKCGRMHGHSYTLKVFISGEIDPETFRLRDFSELKTTVCAVTGVLNNRVLNDIDGLEDPTCENVLIWLWDRLRPLVPDLVNLELDETPAISSIYESEPQLLDSFS